MKMFSSGTLHSATPACLLDCYLLFLLYYRFIRNRFIRRMHFKLFIIIYIYYRHNRPTLIPSTKLDTCSSFHLVLKTPIRNSLPSSSPKFTSDSAARSAVIVDDDVEDEDDRRSAALWFWVVKAVVLLSSKAVDRIVRNIIFDGWWW